MSNFNRISSIDLMRGLMLFLMLLFSYPGTETLPSWLSSQKASTDIFGQTCWIFPAFLFLAGISVPFAISARISRGIRQPDIMRHIFIRFISLVIIGILLLNINRLDNEITGMNRNLWAVAVFAGIFLVWNDYRDKDDNFFTITGLRLFGMAALTFLVFKFRSGQPENDGSLIISWWGYPGLIGWGYLVAGLIYLFFRNSTFLIVLITLGFLALNILSDLSMIRLPQIAGSLGVVTGGHVSFMALTGVLTGIIIRNYPSAESGKAILVLSGIVVAFAAAGIFIPASAILPADGTTAMTLLSSAACLLLYIVLYLIADVRKPGSQAGLIRLAGENSLTTYIAPLLVYYLILISGLPVLFFKGSESMLVVVAGSTMWALLMILMTAFLARLNIRLRL